MAGKGGDSGDKTEKPTPQRLRQSRREGQTWRSPEIGSWLGMLAATYLLPHVVASTHRDSVGLFQQLGTVAADPQPQVDVSLLATGLRDVVLDILPLAVVAIVVSLTAGIAQGGLRFAAKPIKPTFSRLNLIKGIGRVFGKQGAFEAVKALLKATVITLLVWSTLSGLIHTLIGAPGTLSMALQTAAGTALSLARTCAAVGLAVGGLDMAHRRRKLMSSLKMSISEVKREQKMSEGDPHLKGKIRSRQLAMSRNRMISAVASADVVIVNPVHVAVALRYTAGKGAPRVVAAGRGAIALRIREVAQDARVPVVVDIPLARTLHRLCDLGAEIPPELFTAVARVLAFVMGLKRRGSAAGVHTVAPSTGLPGPEVKKVRQRRLRRVAAHASG